MKYITKYIVYVVLFLIGVLVGKSCGGNSTALFKTDYSNSSNSSNPTDPQVIVNSVYFDRINYLTVRDTVLDTVYFDRVKLDSFTKIDTVFNIPNSSVYSDTVKGTNGSINYQIVYLAQVDGKLLGLELEPSFSYPNFTTISFEVLKKHSFSLGASYDWQNRKVLPVIVVGYKNWNLYTNTQEIGIIKQFNF